MSCSILLARISANDELHVVHLPGASDEHTTKTCVVEIPSIPKSFVHATSFLRWSDQAIDDDGAASVLEGNQTSRTLRLLMGSEDRIIALQLDIFIGKSAMVARAHILIDIGFPTVYGKITSLDFTSGYESALILFDLASFASILSLTRAERDDIPDRKFATSQGYALSHNGQHLAVLIRDKHTDRVVILENSVIVSSFVTDTIDAQGIRWSPDGKPLIVIWDTAAHGTRVKFFTAMGAPLKKLDFTPTSDVSSRSGTDMIDIGVCAIDWKKSHDPTTTALAIGIGSRRIMYRCIRPDSVTITSRYSFQCPTSSHSTTTTTWQQIDSEKIAAVPGQWTYDSFRKNSGCEDAEIVSINADGSLIAGTVNDGPRIVFIWKPGSSQPISVFILEHEVRQLLWHPVFPDSLVIVSNNKSACIYHWSVTVSAPTCIQIPSLQSLSSKHWKGRYLSESPRLDSSMYSNHYFMLSSTKFCDIGIIESTEHGDHWISALEVSLIPPGD